MMMMSSFEFEEVGGHQRKLRAESFWPASVWFLYQRGVVNHNNVMRWTLSKPVIYHQHDSEGDIYDIYAAKDIYD